jgi:hypothetical protein
MVSGGGCFSPTLLLQLLLLSGLKKVDGKKKLLKSKVDKAVSDSVGHSNLCIELSNNIFKILFII